MGEYHEKPSGLRAKFDNTQEGNLWDNNLFFKVVGVACEFTRDNLYCAYHGAERFISNLSSAIARSIS